MITSKNDIKTLSAKSVKERVKRESIKIIDNAKAQAMVLESAAIETAKDKFNDALKECEDKISEKIEEETGFSPQEARYLTINAYKKAKEIVTNKDNIVENHSKEMKVRKPESLKEIFKKMPDDLYNAFFLNETLEVIDKCKTIAAQTRNLGAKAIDEVVDHINFIKDNINPEGILESPENDDEEIKSTVDIKNNEEISINEELITELGKSKVSTTGKKYTFSDKKKISNILKIALQGLMFLLPILEILKHLIENYRTNKNGLRDDSAKRINDLFESQASGEKVEASKIFDGITKKEISSQEEKIEYNPDKIDIISDSENAYVSDYLDSASELDRIYSEVSFSIKSCKYDPRFPLVNKSTSTNGGKVENLKYAGNYKKELIDAIEALSPILE